MVLLVHSLLILVLPCQRNLTGIQAVPSRRRSPIVPTAAGIGVNNDWLWMGMSIVPAPKVGTTKGCCRRLKARRSILPLGDAAACTRGVWDTSSVAAGTDVVADAGDTLGGGQGKIESW